MKSTAGCDIFTTPEPTQVSTANRLGHEIWFEDDVGEVEFVAVDTMMPPPEENSSTDEHS